MSHEVNTICNPRPAAGSWRVQLIPDPQKWAWDLIVYKRDGEFDRTISDIDNAPRITPSLVKACFPSLRSAKWALDEVARYNGQIDKFAGATARTDDYIFHLSAFVGNEISAQALVDEFNDYLDS